MFKIRLCLSILILLISIVSYGQVYKISGVILNEKKEPLPLASVEIKELKVGSISKDDGSYSFNVERGKYDLVVSIIGYKTKVTTFYINDADVTQNVEMEIDDASLGEVIVKAKLRDRAEEIVKK